MADKKKIPGQKFKNEFSWSKKKKKKKKKEKEKAVQCDKKKSNNIKYQSNEPALTVIIESLEN